jgi:hypothetical protein
MIILVGLTLYEDSIVHTDTITISDRGDGIWFDLFLDSKGNVWNAVDPFENIIVGHTYSIEWKYSHGLPIPWTEGSRMIISVYEIEGVK